MFFEALVVVEAGLCALLASSAVKSIMNMSPAPEVELCRRAWVAARFGISQAQALGPLFKHLQRAASKGLQEAHRLQDEIRGVRERHHSSGWLAPAASLGQRRRIHRSTELAELCHVVEQLEQMTCAIARYRGGIGMLADLRVAMRCLQAPREP